VAGQTFSGKVALVTGASSGIGQAVALALAAEGADVALNYFSYHEQADQTAAAIRNAGRQALQFPVDVSDYAAVEAMVEQIVQQLGHLDLLVTSAVYSDRELFHLADLAGFHRTINVSMFGAFYALRATVRHMIPRGQGGLSLIHISEPTRH